MTNVLVITETFDQGKEFDVIGVASTEEKALEKVQKYYGKYRVTHETRDLEPYITYSMVIEVFDPSNGEMNSFVVDFMPFTVD